MKELSTAERALNSIGLYKSKESYSLRLANGLAWQIEGTKDIQGWLDFFTSVLGLKKCTANGFPKLFFTKIGSASKMFNAGNQWLVLFDLNGVRIWSHFISRDLVIEVEPRSNPFLNLLRIRFALFSVYCQAQAAGGVLFHGGLVELKGKGVLLSAPSGGGKSTCCRRIPLPWRALCDDETLIVKNGNDAYFAHPLPTWSDQLEGGHLITRSIEQYVPLKAVFFLEQAEKDDFIYLTQKQALFRIFEQVIGIDWPNLGKNKLKKIKEEAFVSACNLSNIIPAYILRVSFTGRFWEVIEQVLK